MERRAFRVKTTFMYLSVLLFLEGSIAWAGDPNGLILTSASISELEIEESIGQARLGATIIRAPGILSLSVEGEGQDLLGIRVRERYVLPNGVESIFEESYPVFAHGVRRMDLYAALSGGFLEESVYVPIHFRSGNRVKDEQQWQAFLDRVDRGETSKETDTPPVWITMPDPNAVEVFVSIYDMKGRESKSLAVFGPKSFGRPRVPRAPSGIALMSYEEKGSDFARWAEGAKRSGSENAALLYLRAALYYEVPDPCTSRLIDLMARGREPDDRVLAFLGDNLKTIELVQLASQLPNCDFGPIHEPRGYNGEMWSSLRKLSFLMAAHGRSLAAGGHYKVAFENCLVNRHLAQHIGDHSPRHYLVARSFDASGVRAIRQILQDAPLETETLKWLRHKITSSEGAPWRPAVLAQWDLDRSLSDWEFCKGDRPFERTWALGQVQKDIKKGKENNPSFSYSVNNHEIKAEEIMQLSDEQLYVCMLCRQRLFCHCQYDLVVPDELLAKARQTYDSFVDSAIEIMDSDMSYEQKQAQLVELDEEFTTLRESHAPISLLEIPGFTNLYELRVQDVASLNLLKVALEVRLIAIETGVMPKSLPEGLPKDPYTGKDFGYIVTKDGFMLRFDPNDLTNLRVREFEFKVFWP